jgi:hypothetical protein
MSYDEDHIIIHNLPLGHQYFLYNGYQGEIEGEHIDDDGIEIAHVRLVCVYTPGAGTWGLAIQVPKAHCLHFDGFPIGTHVKFVGLVGAAATANGLTGVVTTQSMRLSVFMHQGVHLDNGHLHASILPNSNGTMSCVGPISGVVNVPIDNLVPL